MQAETVPLPAPSAPFPLYADLTARLLGATDHPDPTLTHALALFAAYAYADTTTMATMASRAGFRGDCTRFTQVVDAMYVFSTAYVLRSGCGRVAVVAYRGTELANVGAWLGDIDVGDERLADGTRVHAGFHRNMRATRFGVVDALRAMDGLEAVYVTGHSLGGAMAALLALSLADDALGARVRAVYTYGQPLTCEPSARVASLFAHTLPLHRFVLARDPIPALPVAAWGRLAHCGHEHRFGDDGWRKADAATTQLRGVWSALRPLLARFGDERRRRRARLTLADHGPHRYLAALRPAGQVSEFGD